MAKNDRGSLPEPAPLQGAAGAKPRRATRDDPDAGHGGIQVISRAAEIMKALDSVPGGLSLGEIAVRVGLPRSTVQRIVKALLFERFLMPSGINSRVTLGPLQLRLASGVQVDVVQLVRPILDELSDKAGETVGLSMYDRGRALFVDQVSAPNRLAAIARVGEFIPLDRTANGKALLAAIHCDAKARALVGEYLQALPLPFGGSAELAAIVETKVAFDNEEYTEGVSAVGTWFCDRNGQPYAISIPVPTMRFDGGTRLVDLLLAARQEVIRSLALKE